MNDSRKGKNYAMAVLELVTSRPDWMGALTVALTRPQGVPERRARRRSVGTRRRPRRAPAPHLRRPRVAAPGLRRAGRARAQGLEDTAAVAAWETDHEAQERLSRLRDRRVLDAAGFLLHEEERIAV